MDEDDNVETEAEEIDALLALQEEETDFQEDSDESSTDTSQEEPDLTSEGPGELLVPTIANMSVVVGGTTLNLETTPWC
jgi:hypothetical protein